MATKIQAAKYVTDAGIDCSVIGGDDPQRIYDLLEGQTIGTLFKAKEI